MLTHLLHFCKSTWILTRSRGVSVKFVIKRRFFIFTSIACHLRRAFTFIALRNTGWKARRENRFAPSTPQKLMAPRRKPNYFFASRRLVRAFPAVPNSTSFWIHCETKRENWDVFRGPGGERAGPYTTSWSSRTRGIARAGQGEGVEVANLNVRIACPGVISTFH